MEVLHDERNGDFFLAVSSGNVEEAEYKLQENPGLAKIKIQNGMLPIHIAALCGQRKTLQRLFHQPGLDDLEWEQKVQLFFITIKKDMYGNEIHLFSPFSVIIIKVLNLKLI